MSYTDWKDKTDGFKKIDVRGIQGNFFQGIKKHAIPCTAQWLKILLFGYLSAQLKVN